MLLGHMLQSKCAHKLCTEWPQMKWNDSDNFLMVAVIVPGALIMVIDFGKALYDNWLSLLLELFYCEID